MAPVRSDSARGVLLRNEPLAMRTSWRVGGKADTYFEPADRDELVEFVRSVPASEPILWLGLGSNLLVRDGGFRGTVICLHGVLDDLRLESETRVFAEAGVHCARLAKFAGQKQRAGLGFMAGIPGTVGGALAMNAGAWNGETWPNVAEVEVLYRDGRCAWHAAAEFRFDYRRVALPEKFCGFLGARFVVTEDTDGEHLKYTRESLARRKASQPVGKSSAGSTFRNPPGEHAARLIDECGLKGHRIGGAEVSTLHANFIITDAGASAADVEALISHVQSVVRYKTGIDLETEVRIVGVAA